jgi:quercetin dioxygenase-like cupin family protein
VSATAGKFGMRAEVRAVEIFPGVYRRTIVAGDRAMVVEVTLPKGSIVPDHAHPHEQCGYLVSGKLRFTIDDTTATIAPGDGWVVPGDARHSVVALEDSIAIDVFSPLREEYLSQ